MKNFIKQHKLKLFSLPLILIIISANAQEINWHSIDAGGGISTGNNGISLLGVIGQSDSIRMTSGNTSLSGGYLPLPVDNDLIFVDSFE
jgi:hypothetical protein